MRRDLRYAWRVLARNPSFALTAILSIAGGIAACTAIFSFAYALLLRPLNVPGAGSLVSIYGVSTSNGALRAVSMPDYRDLATRTDVFDAAGAYFRAPVFVVVDGEAERAAAELPTGNYHRLMGVRPALGRMLRDEDDRPGAPFVAVVSESFWRGRMGARQDAIGRTLRVNGVVYEIVGVAPASFTGVLLDWYGAPELWLPLSSYTAINARFAKLEPDARRDFPWLQMTARLRGGVTVEAATAALQAQAGHLARTYPASNQNVTFTATPAARARFWPGRRGVVVDFAAVLLGLVGGMLLIAVVNVANLLVARMAARQREIGIRLAIGADRVSLARQMLIEGLMLSAIATLASVPLTIVLTRLIARFDLPFFIVNRALDLSPDWRVFGVVAALCAGCGILLGLMPAWHAWRTDVRAALAAGPAVRRTRFGTWDMRHTLAALQIAVCLVLTLGAGLLTNKLLTLTRADLGYTTTGVTLFELETYLLEGTAERRAAAPWELLARVRRLPGVESAALAFKTLPSNNIGTNTVAAPGALDPRARQGIELRFNVVSDDYFATLRIPLTAGRSFDDRGETAAARTAIVNETAARRWWGEPARAIGQRVRVTDAQKRVTDREVIGVVRDAVYAGLDEAPMPYLFLPLDRAWSGALTLHVRGPRDAGALAAHARRELRAVAPSMAFSSIQTLDRYVTASIAAPVLAATLALAASGMGMALAILGLYAVLAYLIAQRRVDFAIRTAIGAPPRQIVALITGFGVKIAAAGAALGLLGSMVVLRLLATQFGGIDVYDPLVYAVVIGLLALAITAACLVPARRAAHADPWVILSRRH